jgi:putative transposase
MSSISIAPTGDRELCGKGDTGLSSWSPRATRSPATGTSSRIRCERKWCASLLTPHAEYLALSEDPANRVQAYRNLFENGLDASELKRIREAGHSGLPLGSEAFKARMEIDLGRKLRHGRPGRPKSGSDPDFQTPR